MGLFHRFFSHPTEPVATVAPAAAPRRASTADVPPPAGEQRSSNGASRSRRRRRRSGRRSNSQREPDRSRAAAVQALSSGGYRLPALEELDRIDRAQYPPDFEALDLSDRSLATVTALGFNVPTPIQRETIPVLLSGADVVGQAQTGTGKTLAFGLPLVERLDRDSAKVQGIVLVPTRELADQVFSVLDFLATAAGLQAIALMGGRRLDQDFANLAAQPQIVVGTPGRVIDHLERRTLDLSGVRVAVLDEADRMLDIGFEPDIRRILNRSPRNRQTALYSATIPTTIKTLIWRYMRDPQHVHTETERTIPLIRQRYYEVAERDKLDALMELFPEMRGRTLIFCNMKVTVDRLVRRLQSEGVPAEAIHGDMDQRKRDRVMRRFRAGELQILVATNVAARGLDIEDVKHVVNFDAPHTAEDYIHRVGRTGRAGRDGSATIFVAEWDLETFESIRKAAGPALERGQLALYAS